MDVNIIDFYKQDSYKQTVIQFFDRRTTYDREGDRHPQEAQRLMDWLTAFAPLQAGQRVLDVATGTGLIAIAAATQVGATGQVIGIDLSAGMLQQARAKSIAAQLPQLQLQQLDAEQAQFTAASFDVICCCSAVTYLCDIPTAFTNWYDWLKSGGAIAFTCPSELAYLAPLQRQVCRSLFHIDLPHINDPLGNPDKITAVLQQAGFQDIAIDTGTDGNFLNLDQLQDWRLEQFFYPRGNPLANLSIEDCDRLHQAFQLAAQDIAIDQRIWQDRTTFFVRAKKPSAVNCGVAD